MSILSVCAAALVASILAVVLKRHNAEYSLILTLGAVTIICVTVISEIALTLTGVSSLIKSAGVNQKYIKILFKCIGICFLTEFTCDTCKDASQTALSSIVLMAGRICTLVAALPLFEEFIELSLNLSGGKL